MSTPVGSDQEGGAESEERGVTLPRRVQLRRSKGWRKPPNTVVVSRPSKWGNPYRVADYGRPEAVRLYWEHLRQHPELVAAARRELRGKHLACWCGPGAECHADLLMAAANDGTAGEPSGPPTQAI
jgi:Domain of unknown function (DUF4326)